MMVHMNKYSKILVLLSFIIIMTAEFYDDRAVYVAFGLLVLGFLFPMIVTKVTGEQFKGN